MRFILARLYGLLNREVDSYKRLTAEMLNERQALLTRDLSLLKGSLESQQKVVDELHDIRRDRQEEMRALIRKAGWHYYSDEPTIPELSAQLGTSGEKLYSIWQQVEEVVSQAKRINAENKKIIDISHSFFSTYIEALSQIRSRIFGYDNAGKWEGRAGRNILINQQG